MHILYIDDSGSVENANERHFVLGGVSVFERGLYHQIKAADECVASFKLGDPHDIELHGTEMYHGRKGVWHSVSKKADREAMVQSALGTLKGHRSTKLFAVVVDKEAISPKDPIATAFEEMCNRFNLFLKRVNDRRQDGEQRGLIVMDEMKHEKPLQTLARKFRIDGARWGHFRNLAEVPLFADSRASRLIQMADLVSWSTFRKYEFSDGRFFDPLIPLFDADGGVIHGLVHLNHEGKCYCPACFSRFKHGAKANAV